MIYNSFRLAIFEIQKRSLNTYAGWTWSLMNPLAQMAILYFIMNFVFKSDIENMTLWLISSLTSWIIIQTALLKSCQSLVSRRALMQNNNISSFLLVMADILSEVLVLAPFYIIGIIVSIYNGISLFNLMFIPVLFLFLIVFLFGLGLILATLTPILRDLPYLLGIVLQVAFWLTPIAYAKTHMTGVAAIIVTLNPFTHFILLSQAVFMGKQLTFSLFLIPFLLAGTALIIGILLSNSLGKKTVISL
ncbi:ABC transporter permease [Yersinia enterocolitica]|uniref:Lipopolysaccharide transport system permease n=1 Tax=Yersinia enterocolitica TaxID=630 RepID=A0A0H5HPY5_YEREN|nr:ABC transporter permease [Yersinia enterocolitica]EKN3331957.1 ABC transporter permease [Yersinia enterocolitica]EKN3412620.1 ABC transporter permease [Yersinia enterocolitica]EKN3494230.1 ABC transporter permease [Yersinia enterocolitica]EKN3510521.1 ABC transporter permease [Yersinia enterocolitica]EKN3555154.1 ABC transporter permease [Yersinia enterocolitica]